VGWDQNQYWDIKTVHCEQVSEFNLWNADWSFQGAESAKLWSNALDFHIQAVPSNQESLDMLEKEFRKKLEPVWARDLTLVGVFYV
jgi:hypothetical protein